jgi:hypothetical protein
MSKPPPLPSDASPTHSWWDRNWKWFSALLGVVSVAVMVGFIALIFGTIRSSDVYQAAMAQANADATVVENLGTPIHDGFFTNAQITVRGDSGTANLAIPLRGPKGTARLFGRATKSQGEWHFEELVVRIDRTKETFDLVKQPWANGAAGRTSAVSSSATSGGREKRQP